MSSDLNTLHPYVKFLANKFLEKCRQENFPVAIYFTYRTIKEQDELYAKGRTTKGPKVTNARGGYSYHNYGLAFDAAPLVNGKIDWNNESLFKKMGQIGESVGLEWGGNWKSFKDTPHFQWTGGLTVRELLAGKRPVAPDNFEVRKDESNTPDINYVSLLKLKDIKSFQKNMGLQVDGIIGPKTKEVINKILKMPKLKKGDNNIVVRYLQYRLYVDIDGDFGVKTEKALKAWQQKNKLDVNGMCSEKEWDILI
ncbi:MAG: peptidoglycan-binding protein [Peptostreptococcaceae bacterium]